MKIKNAIERDWAAKLSASAPLDLQDLTYHASIDSDQHSLPSVIITADDKPLIESNKTYDVTLQVILATSSDDTADALAIDYAEQLTEFIDSSDFLTGVTARATCWAIVHLEHPTTDATDTEDRRYIQRSTYRLIAQA